MRRRLFCLLACVAVAGSVLVPVAARAGGGCHGPAGDTTEGRGEGDAVSTVITKCAFRPTVLYVDAGTEVTWSNKDIFDHTVTGANYTWGSEAIMTRGDTISQRFESDGVYPYFCMLHPGMVGVVIVGDPDPAAAPLKVTSIDTSGIQLSSGSDGEGGTSADGSAPQVNDDPASDSIPTSVLAGTIALLGLAAVVGFALVRRRSRVEQGV